METPDQADQQHGSFEPEIATQRDESGKQHHTDRPGSGAGLQALLGARYSLGERAFIDAGVRYLLVSNVDLDAEEGAVGRVEADYEPLAVTVSFGWRF